ncbi:sugar kinase [Clostridium sp. MSJ-8]|uniref:sugar kinase n=1 Tax=Clostridium sp. MSJ-8 TaxID=2841510 RepID=UPI00209E19E7|nr:sugar kinase [Clostridium sp. MSJ-8]
MRTTERKIILITRKSRLENLIRKYNTIEQAKFIIEHSGADFNDYVDEHNLYKKVVSSLTIELEQIGIVQILDREYISNFIFGQEDIIVIVGQDGLIANVLKYIDNQPVIGINPDPARYDGILLPFDAKDASKVVIDVINNERNFKEVTLAKASLNDGQSILGVNDIFIGQRTHTSAQYILEQNNAKERQSSSGIIVSTGLGSTGWFKSILKGASEIVGKCENKNIILDKINEFKWNSDFLYYTVREPYPSKWTKADMVFGKVNKNATLSIQSLMPENGVIFSDGIENDYLEFNAGSIVEISIADHKGRLIV